jgi:predicted transcriptional regulator
MRRLLFLASLLTLTVLLPGNAAALNVGEQASGLCLKDSRGRVHRMSSFHKRILVVWYEGVKSRHQNHWIKLRLAELQRSGRLKSGNYESVGIANFHETVLPGALIVSAIREHTRRTSVRILLDREGELRQRWGFFNGRSNIYVFDAKRRLIWRSSGPLSRRLGRQLVRMIVRRAR